MSQPSTPRPLRRLILWWNVLAPVVAAVLLAWGRAGWAVGVLFSAHAPWLWATLIPSSRVWGPQRRRVEGGVWLTIDDGPDPQDTPKLLDLLDRYEATATFFLIGCKAQQWPELVREIHERGHSIGNHTLDHPSGGFWCMGSKATRLQAAGCRELLEALVPEADVSWFRAPAGLRNHCMHPVLKRLGLRLAGWSVRGLDGVDKDPRRVIRRLKRGLKSGAIVLLHEGRKADDGCRLAPQVLEAVLAELRHRQLSTVPPPASY